MMPPRKRRLILTTAALLSSASAGGTRAAASTTPQHDEDINRRRLKHKERTMSAWRSLNSSTSVRPLDLKLDESDPTKVYQVGIGGFLEPYDINNYQSEFEVTHLSHSTNEGPALSTSGAMKEGGGNAEGIVHHQSDRFSVTNFDLNRWTALEGYSDTERKLDGDANEIPKSRRLRVSADTFKFTEGNDPYDLDENPTVSSRSLGRKQADDFANPDNEAPVVRSTFPPENTKIGPNQSFGALVSDNGTGVKSVCLQLRDHMNSLSDCFDLVNVGFDVWELTFDGFDAFEGEIWSYRIRSKDGAKNRVNTRWADFVINISGKREENDGWETETDETGDSEQSGKLTKEVRDESWPYGGVVQKSTGRILFFFDGNAYVCTGTVLDDEIEDRTVIVSLFSRFCQLFIRSLTIVCLISAHCCALRLSIPSPRWTLCRACPLHTRSRQYHRHEVR
jgi:hypothetical protein